jgi:hypothetical protein
VKTLLGKESKRAFIIVADVIDSPAMSDQNFVEFIGRVGAVCLMSTPFFITHQAIGDAMSTWIKSIPLLRTFTIAG